MFNFNSEIVDYIEVITSYFIRHQVSHSWVHYIVYPDILAPNETVSTGNGYCDWYAYERPAMDWIVASLLTYSASNIHCRAQDWSANLTLASTFQIIILPPAKLSPLSLIN